MQKNYWNGKQIEMIKCKGCESYFATYLVKDGKCKICVESVPEQIVAEQAPTDANKNDNTNNV